MNKTAIKNFAVWARRKLISDITYKAGMLGITDSGIAEPLPISTKDLQFFDIGTKDYAEVSGNEISQRKALVDAIKRKEKTSKTYKEAFEYIVEEVAYTWFNRLIAIRFMEVNDYLPSGIRVLSSENTAKSEPDFVTTPFDTDLDFTSVEQDKVNVAYHGYQSFKSGEVTPKEAHDIGLETARRMWGKDYEIIVTTHLNTDNIHNHIVINSVSFKTGRKFENHISDHIHFREISDEICKEYSKSVIEGAKFYSNERNSYWIHKNGGKTHRNILREDVDAAIKQAGSLLEFERIMTNMGYTFNRNISAKHPSVIAKGWQRPVRIDSLGDDYSTERLAKRISGNGFIVSSFVKSDRVHKSRPKHTPLAELEYHLRRVKYMDTLEAIFYLLLELLKPSKQTPDYRPPLSPAMRQEIRKFEQYQKQFRLLHDEKINTAQELETFISKISKQIEELENERYKADNKRRRAKTDEDKEAYKAEMRNISIQIKPLRDKLKIAKAALDSVPKVQRLLDIERDMENKILHKERSRTR